MTKLTKKEIEKIAELARLELSEKEVGYYADELSAVLDYAEQLNALKTDGVEPMAQATEHFNAFKSDEQEDADGDARVRILKNIIDAMPFREKGFLKVKSVFKDRN